MLDMEKLIPHRDRMKLVSEVLDVNSEVATTASTVTEKWPLCDQEGVNCLVLIELVAQTSALAIGWESYQEDPESDIQGKGWLVGIKEAAFHKEKIPQSTRIITHIEISFNMNNYTEVRGSTETEHEQLSTITLQVYRKDKENEGE